MLVNRTSSSKLRKSFSIIIMACLLIIFFVGFDDIRAKARDNKRKADMIEVVKALELYYDRFNRYPDSNDKDWYGWDATFEPSGHSYEFIPPLTNQSILLKGPVDPYNNSTYFYRYQRFPQGSFGCQRPFYILQIVNFETVQDDHGQGKCPEQDFAELLPNGYTFMRME